MEGLARILVPVDGSDVSGYAMDFAAALAKATKADLVLCNSVDLTGAIAQSATPYGATDITPLVQALEDESKAILAGAAARVKPSGVPTASAELAGGATGAILEAVSAQRADAIVMGTHGRKGASRFFLGSTAEGVLRGADCPVFVVSSPSAGGQTVNGLPSRSTTPIPPMRHSHLRSTSQRQRTQRSPSLTSWTSARCTRWPHPERFPATAAFAQEREAARALLDRAVDRAKARGISAQSVVLEGSPVETLLEFAQSESADLIAIGTHGRRGIRRLLFGSVAEGVTRSSPVPVLVVRQAHRP